MSFYPIICGMIDGSSLDGGFNEDELEHLLKDGSATEASFETMMSAQRDNDAQVLASLREVGLSLDVPTNFTMTLFEYGLLLEKLIPAEEEGEREISQRRTISLIFHANSVSGAMDFLPYSHQDGTSAATEHKIVAQFEILEDDQITEVDKAQLLDVLDALVPVDGIDFTDPVAFDSIRKQLDNEREIARLRIKYRQVINELTEAELIPVYGEHDEYGQFKAQLRHWLVHLKRIAGGDKSAEHLQPLADDNFNELLKAATAIGISDDALEAFVAYVDSCL